MQNITPCPVDTNSSEFTALYNALKNHEYNFDYEYKPGHFITLQHAESLDEDSESVDSESDDVDVHIIHFHSGNPDEDEEDQDGGALELPNNPSNKEIHDAVEFILDNIFMK